GQDENEGRGCLESQIEWSGPEHLPANLRDHTLVFDRDNTQGACQEGDPQEHHAQKRRHDNEGLPSIVRLGVLEGGDTITDRFNTCHGGAPRRKGTQYEQRGQCFKATDPCWERRGSHSAERTSDQAGQSDKNEPEEEEKKSICGDGEYRTRLADATQ